MNEDRIELINNVFMSQLESNIDSAIEDVGNVSIENFGDYFSEVFDFINNGSSEFDSPLVMNEKREEALDFIRGVVTKLSDVFHLEIRLDSFLDIRDLYSYFVINRWTRVAIILFFSIRDIDFSKYQNVDKEVQLDTLFKTIKNFRLDDIFEDYYLAEGKNWHDKIFFDTPSQRFIDSFFPENTPSIEEIECNIEVRKELSSLIQRKTLKDLTLK